MLIDKVLIYGAASLVIAFAILAASPPLFYNNQADWRMYRFDVEHTGANLGENLLTKENVNSLDIKWTFGNTSFFATPTVVDRTVYIGELQSRTSNFYALDLFTGRLKWKANLTAVNSGSWDRGIFGSAAFDNNVVYIGNNEAMMYALSSRDGSVIWGTNLNQPVPKEYHDAFPLLTTEEEANYLSFPATEEFYVRHDPDAIMTSPLIVENTVYVGIASNTANTPCSTGRVVALNKKTGETMWTTLMVPDRTEVLGPDKAAGESEASYYGYNFGAAVWATPAYDKNLNRLYVATGNACGLLQENPDNFDFNYANSILALDPRTGKIIWAFTRPEVLGQDLDFGASPLIFNDEDGTRYVGSLSKSGEFFAVRTGIAEQEETVIINSSDIGSYGWRVRLGPESESPHSGGGLNSPTFANGRIFVGSGIKEPRYQYTGDHTASLFTLNPKDGSVLNEYPSTFAFLGASAAANGMIFFSNGTHVISMDADNYNILWSQKLENVQAGIFDFVQPLLGGISVSNGFVLVGSINHLYALSVS